jgi:acyl-lipid omega-6 desaturase (Delta-12 desaturase)
VSLKIDPGAADGAMDAPAWARRLARYRKPDAARGALEVIITAGPLIALLFLAFEALRLHIWWGLALVPLAAAFLTRLFAIQHDCGHGSFLPWRLVNDWLGRAIGVLTLTPYDYWRGAHAIHHATSGALDRRETGAIDTLTVDEYLTLPLRRRFAYRLYRNPLVMFGLGPAFVFLVQNRLPVGMMGRGWRPWVSALATNLVAAIMVIALIGVFGLGPFLLIYLPVVTLAGSAGVWLFFVQHQFEDAYWAREGVWEFHEAALRGSSHYDLPPVLRWFTANIGIHHVHHLSSRIPYYLLNKVMLEEPALRAASRMTLQSSLRCLGLALWDDSSRRMISFRELRGRSAMPTASGARAAPDAI